VRISGRDYVDGGLVSPVPVQFARQMGAELVLAVDISTPPEGNSASDTLQILMQAQIYCLTLVVSTDMQQQLEQLQKQQVLGSVLLQVFLIYQEIQHQL
jgi:predicted acylesterase/phospholipase RssA